MDIFDNIKIDKSKVSYEKGLLSGDDRESVDNSFREYYGKIMPSQSKGTIYYEFNPNRQIMYSNIDHNFQGVSEGQLYEALFNITQGNKALQDEIKYTRLDLCKDYLLKSSVSDVLAMLNDNSYPYGKAPKTKQTTENSYTVYLASPHQKQGSEEEGTMIIRFYDKVAEYFDKHNTYILPLKSPISENEILRLGNAYDGETNTINLEHLNILRIEFELHQSKRLKPIAEKLTGETQEFLSVGNVIQALEKGTLYHDLDEYYTYLLNKFVFPIKKAFVEDDPTKISKERELAVKLLDLSPNKYKYKLQAMSRGKKTNENFNEIFKLARIGKSNSELYQELYNEVFKGSEVNDIV